MKRNLYGYLFLIGSVCTFCGPSQADAGDISFLPSGGYFGTITLDPSACQLGGSLLAFALNGDLEPKAYIPLSLGVEKMILRREQDTSHGFEIGFEIAIFTQFDIVDVGEAYLGTMLNADYRVAALLHYRDNRHTYRFRLFHMSSHLGDDYIIRNQVNSPTSNLLNYEQLDLTRSTQSGDSRYYYGLGLNVSPHTIRERLAAQLGCFYTKPLASRPDLRYLYGADIRVFEQNRYRPNLKLGIGLEFGSSRSNPLRIILEYYNGHLPYSTLEHQLVQLFGIGLYFNTRI